MAYPHRASVSTLLALPLVIDHIYFILPLTLMLGNRGDVGEGYVMGVTDSQASVPYPFTSIDLASTLMQTLGVGRPLEDGTTLIQWYPLHECQLLKTFSFDYSSKYMHVVM